MSAEIIGAVCDVSVLSDRASFERAKQLVEGGELYLPSATYSWLVRDKLISVRGRAISYSLVSQFVRDRELLVIYLPELLDELSRRLLFKVEREIPLTDLRALMLAAHLQLPFLTFDDEPIMRLQKHAGAYRFWELDLHADESALNKAIQLYRGLMIDVGDCLNQCLKNGEEYEYAIQKLRKNHWDDLKSRTMEIRRLGQARANPGELSLVYTIWDLIPILRDYIEQHVVQPEIVRNLCERTILLVASEKG